METFKKVEKSKKLLEEFEQARNFVKLENYLYDHVARFRVGSMDDAEVNSFYKCFDMLVSDLINMVLEVENYVETFGNLRIASGFVTDTLYACVQDSEDFYIFLGRINNIIDELNDAGIVLESF